MRLELRLIGTIFLAYLEFAGGIDNIKLCVLAESIPR